MRTIQSLLFSLACVLMVTPALAHAADVAFFPVETSNLAPEDSVAIGELLAQSYASASRKAVLSPARTQEVLSRSANYEAAAAQLGVSEYVRMTALAAGRRIVISASRYRADGTFVYQSKMTAESVEDVTIVSDRMAKALYEQVDDEQVRTRHNVTLAEGRAQTRVWSEKVVGFKSGVYVPFAKDAKYRAHVAAQFDLRLEMDRFFVELSAGFIIPSATDEGEICHWDADAQRSFCTTSKHGHYAALTGELGGNYFLTDGNIAPYVGIGVMPRIVLNGYEGDTAALVPYAQVGVMLPRDSSTRFYVDARAGQNVLVSHLANGKEVYATEVSVLAGIGW